MWPSTRWVNSTQNRYNRPHTCSCPQPQTVWNDRCFQRNDVWGTTQHVFLLQLRSEISVVSTGCEGVSNHTFASKRDFDASGGNQTHQNGFTHLSTINIRISRCQTSTCHIWGLITCFSIVSKQKLPLFLLSPGCWTFKSCSFCSWRHDKPLSSIYLDYYWL